MEDSELLEKINTLLTQEASEINYEDLILHLKELKKKIPNLKITPDSSRKCFGPCLENNQTYSESELISIPGHHHQYCSKCLTSWVLSSFLKNPFNSIFCQRCFHESFYHQLPIETINSLIPVNISNDYINYFQNALFKCVVCFDSFPYSNIISLFCGHFYCLNDFIKSNLKTFNSIIKGKTDIVKDQLEFSLTCLCNNYSTKDAESLNFFNQKASVLNSYDPLKLFYLKYQNFFQGKSALHFVKCCKKYKSLKNSCIRNCLKCYKCCDCGLPIHEGLNCQDFQLIPDKYFVDLDFWTVEQAGKVTPSFVRNLIEKFLGKTWKIHRILNRFQEISKRFRKVWQYGFVLGDSFEILEKKCNEEDEGCVVIRKSFDFETKFVMVCEVHGDKIERNKGYEGNDRVIYDSETEMKVSRRDQVRYLYLLEMTSE
jgi:hypothetical protein